MFKSLKKSRGASMVEYSLLLFAVLIAAAVAVKKLGPRVTASAETAESRLNSN